MYQAAIAESMGCRGIRVTDPSKLGAALEDGASDPRPTVIDVITSTELSFLDFQLNVGAAAMYQQ